MIKGVVYVVVELIFVCVLYLVEICNIDVFWMVIGGVVLVLFGVCCYVFVWLLLFGIIGWMVVIGVIIFIGYLFLCGVLCLLCFGKVGIDVLVFVVMVVSFILCENVVVFIVLWLFNIGEYL